MAGETVTWVKLAEYDKHIPNSGETLKCLSFENLRVNMLNSLVQKCKKNNVVLVI